MDPISESVWTKKYKINNWNVTGYSIGGLKTSFYISDLNILLDGGFQNFNRPEHIFITHLHADHIGNLHLTVLENFNSSIFTNIYCPVESEKYLNDWIVAFFKCNFHSSNVNCNKIFKVFGVSEGQMINLIFNKKKFIVEIIKSSHRIPTVSYGFNYISNKLKNEYIDKNGKELSELKNSGIDIVYENICPSLLFVGDTDYKIFENENFYKYGNIMIECTFFDDKEYLLSLERKHIHWSKLKEIIQENIDIKFYIFHVSPRYLKDFKSYIDDKLIKFDNLSFLY